MAATYVYVMTDAAGDVLYVGHTGNLWRRLHQHHRYEPWGHRAHRATATVYAKKAEALEWERHLIADLEPEFNVQGNPRHMTWERFLAWSGISDAA